MAGRSSVAAVTGLTMEGGFPIVTKDPTIQYSRKRKAPEIPKPKIPNLSASSLKIGDWQVTSKHAGDITAKVYFSRQRFVWEILEQKRLKKIEVPWSSITGITVGIGNSSTDFLEIEVNRPPLFFREDEAQSRKRTVWSSSSDFTFGQASISGRHLISFMPGILGREYEKLLQCDQLLHLIQVQGPFSQACFNVLPSVNVAQNSTVEQDIQELLKWNEIIRNDYNLDNLERDYKKVLRCDPLIQAPGPFAAGSGCFNILPSVNVAQNSTVEQDIQELLKWDKIIGNDYNLENLERDYEKVLQCDTLIQAPGPFAAGSGCFNASLSVNVFQNSTPEQDIKELLKWDKIIETNYDLENLERDYEKMLQCDPLIQAPGPFAAGSGCFNASLSMNVFQNSTPEQNIQELLKWDKIIGTDYDLENLERDYEKVLQCDPLIQAQGPFTMGSGCFNASLSVNIFQNSTLEQDIQELLKCDKIIGNDYNLENLERDYKMVLECDPLIQAQGPFSAGSGCFNVFPSVNVFQKSTVEQEIQEYLKCQKIPGLITI